MEAVSGVVARLLRGLGLEDAMLGWKAVEQWSDTVGPRIASHTRAVEFRSGTLVVEVEGSTWMQEVGYLKRDVSRRINAHLGADVVRDVRLVLPHGGIRR
jgi:predicted nucleic acid-binding Zn ribbon protein